MFYGSVFGSGSYAGRQNWPTNPDYYNTGEFEISVPQMLGWGTVTPLTFNRRAIVMNLSNHAMTEYSNYNFNSLAHFNGVFVGANENGIYVLDGDDDLDQSVESHVRTGVHDLGSSGVTFSPREACLAYRSDGDIELEVEEDEDDSYSYTFNQVTGTASDMNIPLGKGFTGRFYTLDLKNVSGSRFDIESLRVTGLASSKRGR